MIPILISFLKKELSCAYRQRGQYFQGVGFFVLLWLLFGLAGDSSAQWQSMLPAIIWLGLLLSILLSFEHLLKADFQDGSIAQWFVAPVSTILVVYIRALSFWLTTSVPLCCLVPLILLLYGLPQESLPWMIASLSLGSLSFVLIGMVGVALTVGLAGAGMLLALLILPCYVPVLIFGTQVFQSLLWQESPVASMALLTAVTLIAFMVSPVATVLALQASYE